MSILDELWYGNINPQEQSKENNRAIKELLNLMGRNRGIVPILFKLCALRRKRKSMLVFFRYNDWRDRLGQCPIANNRYKKQQ